MCLVVGEGIRNALPQGGAPLVFGVRNKLSYYGAPPCMKPNMKPTNGQDSDRTRSTQFITLFQRVLWTARFASSKNACFFFYCMGPCFGFNPTWQVENITESWVPCASRDLREISSDTTYQALCHYGNRNPTAAYIVYILQRFDGSTIHKSSPCGWCIL